VTTLGTAYPAGTAYGGGATGGIAYPAGATFGVA
jgi:hypothetical protein